MLFGDGQDPYTRQLMAWQQSIAAQTGADNTVITKNKTKTTGISSSTVQGSSSKIQGKASSLTSPMTTVKPPKSKTKVPDTVSIQNRASAVAIYSPGPTQPAPTAASNPTTLVSGTRRDAARLPLTQTNELDVDMLDTSHTERLGAPQPQVRDMPDGSRMQVALYGESARKRRADEVEEEDGQYSDREVEERVIKRPVPPNNAASPQVSTRPGNAGPSQPSKKSPATLSSNITLRPLTAPKSTVNKHTSLAGPSRAKGWSGVDDSDTYEDARERSNGNADDEDVLQDSDDETSHGLYRKEGDLTKVIKILETLSGKLDRFMTAQINAASISKAVPEAQSAPSPITRATRPSRATRSLPKWDQTVEDTRVVEVQKREIARKVVQGYIRVTISSLQKRLSIKDPLPPGPPDDVMEPTLEEFYFNWLESVDSEFNSLACELIVQKLLADWPALFTANNRKDLRKMVRSHAKYLIKAYARQQAGREDPTERARLLSASANRRRHTTFRQRLAAVEQVPDLQKHKTLLCELGVDGTSSDEEDPDQPGSYRVKRITALGAEVREIKRKLDESYDILVRQPGFKGSRGRKRVYTNTPSTRKFRLKGLPVSCINTLWLKKLTPAQKQFYQFSDYNYDFEYPEEINSL